MEEKNTTSTEGAATPKELTTPPTLPSSVPNATEEPKATEVSTASSSGFSGEEEVVKKITDALERRTLSELREGNETLTPEQADRYQRTLAAWYSKYMEEFVNLDNFVNDEWLRVRENVETNEMAKRIVRSTPEGKRHAILKVRIKYIEKLIASLRGHMKRLNDEYWLAKGN